jgi:hypothetical protein
MPEGLNPIEAGKKLHEHGEAAQERAEEENGKGKPSGRHSRDDLTANTLRNFDASTFNAWFTAFTPNSPQKEAIAIRRFRPQFLVAFNAWMATDPLHNPHAPPGPTYMPLPPA